MAAPALIRVMNDMEGDITEAAKNVIQQANLPVRQLDENAARRQFKLAVEAAQQAKDMETLRAFLAYQARDRNKVWGRPIGDHLLVQVAWRVLTHTINAFENRARNEVGQVWNAMSGDAARMNKVYLDIATRFFAHIERAFEIWKNRDVRAFYFGLPEQRPPAEAQQGGNQHGA